MIEPELYACLLGILQSGITNARSLAYEGKAACCADLLDALDNIPRHIFRWTERSEKEIAMQLSAFSKKYPHHETDYLYKLRNRVASLYY
jgi:hypothetical protein